MCEGDCKCDCCEPVSNIQSKLSALKWKIKDKVNFIKYKFIKPPKSPLVLHAERELTAIGYDLNQKEEDPNKWICKNIIELLEVFSEQGHSGFSAPHCIYLFTKLASFEPLSPLTGDDNEWVEVREGTFQNKRCGNVFKENGIAYDIDAKIFRDSDGGCYTNRDSRMNITFPYTPKREYIDVKKEN
jgi:hypothetical protein